MSSESVCQVALSWVDVGSFHTRLVVRFMIFTASTRSILDTPSYMYSLSTSLLSQTMWWCTLRKRCDTNSLHIKWNAHVPCIDSAVKIKLQCLFELCLTKCTLTNLIFNKCSSSLHNPGKFNPSVHCADVQSFRCHTRPLQHRFINALIAHTNLIHLTITFTLLKLKASTCFGHHLPISGGTTTVLVGVACCK
jgi:hypothetical protein